MKNLFRCLLVGALAFGLSALVCAQMSAASAPAVVAASAPTAVGGISSSPLAVKIESIAPLKIESGPSAPDWTFFVPMIGPLLSGLLALVGVVWGLRIATENTLKTAQVAQQNNDAAIWQKANETELKDIQAKLDGFYMPFTLLAKANKLLADDVKSRQPDGYRMLIKLFDKSWTAGLSEGDRKIVDVVCENAEVLRDIIATKSGLVDGVILEYLSRATVHFKILHLAHKGELGTDAVQFSKYVYPRQLDGVLKLEIERLRARAEQLRSSPGRTPPERQALVIPANLVLPD